MTRRGFIGTLGAFAAVVSLPRKTRPTWDPSQAPCYVRRVIYRSLPFLEEAVILGVAAEDVRVGDMVTIVRTRYADQ